jgi:hypothetical protein
MRASQEQRDKEAAVVNCRWLEKCINNETKTKIECLKCNHVWFAKPKHIKQKSGCPKCYRVMSSLNQKAPQKQRDQEANQINCKWLEQCVNSKTPTKIQCLKCLYTWKARPNSVKRGSGCPKCAKVLPTYEDRDNYAAKINCKWLEPYKTALTKTKIQCLNCNFQWKVVYSSVRRGQGCPKCAKGGFDPSRPALVYLLKDSRGAIKIGITKHKSQRIKIHSKSGWILVKTWDFKTGDQAHQIEQSVLNWWRNELNLQPAYKGIDGWTETVDTKFIKTDSVLDKIEELIIVSNLFCSHVKPYNGADTCCQRS